MYVADPLCIAIFIVLVVHKCKVIELVCWWVCNAICVCGEALSLLLVGNVNACNSYLHVCNVCVHVCNIGVHVCNIGVSVCDTWLYSLWCEWARRCICVDWVCVQCDCLHALQMCMNVCWCVLICLCTHVHVCGMSVCVCVGKSVHIIVDIDVVWVSNGFCLFFQWNQWIPKCWIQSLCNAYQHIQYVHRCSYTCTCQKRACCHMCACVFIMVWLVVWTLINANSKSMLLLLLLPCAVAF